MNIHLPNWFLLLFCFACVCALPARAQAPVTAVPVADLTGKKLRIGLKVGSNLADFSGNITDNQLRLDFHAGGFLHYRLHRRFALQPELLFSGEGTSFNTTNTEIDLNYISLPLVAKFYLTENINLQAGPYASYLLKAQHETRTGSQNIDDLFQKTDFGLTVGGAIEIFRIGMLSARYKIGLPDIYKEAADQPDRAYRNRVIQVSFGLML